MDYFIYSLLSLCSKFIFFSVILNDFELRKLDILVVILFCFDFRPWGPCVWWGVAPCFRWCWELNP